ncbi:thiamine pyrophosphate-binding protein [Effusibacillus consociatus]|uniref:Thiamine pyrophosphate-binding protein n=1 Tax=Effusibacillus consociatus TaxID=1117041 RepID=A0ABV9Q3L9_9BACL
MIKVSDYIAKRLVEYGVKDVFMITGGGAMHLNDSIGKCKHLRYVCNHHEQASAIAAEGYARTAGKPAVVIVTSGPGGTNALTGVFGQWVDSVPVLYLSGQVKQETTIERCREIRLRQLGDQELNIADIVKPFTKFSCMIKNPTEIKKLLDKAVYIATHGRPGPVWLDIPLDVQGAMVDEQKLIEYDPKEDAVNFTSETVRLQASETIKLLQNAKRPVFLAGHGIRIAGAQELFLDLVNQMKIPVVSSFNGFDLIPTEHPLFIGRIGTIGSRAGNFALQNSDLLLAVGSRNNIRQISYNWEAFARAAKKIIVDIDAAELQKPTIVPDLAIHADAKDFLREMKVQLEKEQLPCWKMWLEWCTERKFRYPVVLSEYHEQKQWVNPYYFMELLSESLPHHAVAVAGDGTACVALFQAGIVKKGQRFFWNSGCASMGYDLPAAIGACFANNKKDVICLAGDGSLQMNIQELQTVAHHQLPIKLFVLNNRGYLSIKQTQESFFAGRYVGCDQHSGVSFPDITKIAAAYGLPADTIDNQRNMRDKIQKILNTPGPFVCEVHLTPNYRFSPKLSSERKPDGRIVSKPLEDMYPFLDREEFKQNMLISEWQQDPGT